MIDSDRWRAPQHRRLRRQPEEPPTPPTPPTPPPPPPPPRRRCPVLEGRVAACRVAVRRALRGQPPAAKHPQPPPAWPPAAPSSAVWRSCSRHARRLAALPTAARPLGLPRRCHWLAVGATKRRASRCPGSRLRVRGSGLGLGFGWVVSPVQTGGIDHAHKVLGLERFVQFGPSRTADARDRRMSLEDGWHRQNHKQRVRWQARRRRS